MTIDSQKIEVGTYVRIDNPSSGFHLNRGYVTKIVDTDLPFQVRITAGRAKNMESYFNAREVVIDSSACDHDYRDTTESKNRGYRSGLHKYVCTKCGDSYTVDTSD